MKVQLLLACAIALAACSDGTGDTGATSGAGGAGGGCTAPSGSEAWQVVLDKGDLDRTLLSVWGSGPNDVYAVGGSLGNGLPTLVVHFDGCAWNELSPGGTATYWWVSGTGANDIWMVGETGRITHYDGTRFEEHASGTTATLWGVIAFGPNDAWAVGGTPEGNGTGDDDVLLHWDGKSWTRPTSAPTPKGAAYYKIWGTSGDNLYIVGEFGTIWHKSSGAWASEPPTPIASGTLFTVFGCSENEVYAVGGNDVLRSDGKTWTKLAVALNSSVNGVTCGAPGSALLVGTGGLKQRLVAGQWIDEFKIPPWGDLHGSWADGHGTFWAVGGQFLNLPKAGQPREGIVARYGPGTIADAIAH